MVPFRSGAPCRALWGSPPACAHDVLTCCRTFSCTSGLRPNSNSANCMGTAVCRRREVTRVEEQRPRRKHTCAHRHAPCRPLQPSAQWCLLWWDPKIAVPSPWVDSKPRCTGLQLPQPQTLDPWWMKGAGTPSGSSHPLKDTQGVGSGIIQIKIAGSTWVSTNLLEEALEDRLILDALSTMTEDVVPCSGMLGPQGSANAEQQAMGQVEERRSGCQHPLNGPDKLLRLQGGRRGEQANTFSIDHMATGWGEEKRSECGWGCWRTGMFQNEQTIIQKSCLSKDIIHLDSDNKGQRFCLLRYLFKSAMQTWNHHQFNSMNWLLVTVTILNFKDY